MSFIGLAKNMVFMNVIYQIIYGIVNFIESTYADLTRVIWEELIHGESNYSQIEVIIGFCLLCAFAVIAFYLEDFVDVAMIIALLSFLYSQFDASRKKFNTFRKKFDIGHEEEFSSIFNENFYTFSIMIFLVVFSNLMPKAGHFIMFFLGPKLGIQVPTLMLDLSMSGIWRIFSFEFNSVDIAEFSILAISFSASTVRYLQRN